MKPSDVVTALTCCVKAKRPVIVWGGPGIGKSMIGHQTCNALGRRLFDERASTYDACDLRGLPDLSGIYTTWRTPAAFPRAEHGASILLLDELNRAPVMVMNGLLQLILDRKLGDYRLPDTCEIIACCNRESDGGGVQKMPQAMMNRFIHLDMDVDLEDWCKWAVQNNIEPAVIAFLRWKPELLHQFSLKDRAFPTPRSWQFVSEITSQKPGNGIEHGLYAGTVGEGAAIEYSAFLRMFRELPSIDAILLNPGSAPVPSGPGTLFAVAAALARRVTAATLGRVVQYFDRLPQEYAIYGVQDAVRRDSSLQATPEFTRWAVAHADVLF